MFRPDLARFYRVNLFFFLDLLKVLGRDIIKFCFIRFSWGQQSFPRTGSTGTRSSGMFFKLINNMINILTDRDDVQGFTVRPRRRLDQDEKNQHHGRHLGARCCCCCCCSSNEKIQWNSTLLPWNSFWNTTRHRKGCPDWLIAYRWNESLFFCCSRIPGQKISISIDSMRTNLRICSIPRFLPWTDRWHFSITFSGIDPTLQSIWTRWWFIPISSMKLSLKWRFKHQIVIDKVGSNSNRIECRNCTL